MNALNIEMRAMAPKTNPVNDLWNRGIHLRRAPYAYAPKSDKEEHKRLYSVSAIELTTKAADDTAASGLTGWEAVNAILSASNPILSARTELRNRMRAFVLHHLITGSLIAYGFEPPRRMDSMPFHIPAAYWRGRIQWEDSKLTAQGLEFEQIRLITLKARDQVLGVDANFQSVTKKAGRPGYRDQIIRAFETLNAIGKIDTQSSLQAHYKKVRDWIELNVPEGERPTNPLSDNTLQRHLSPLFNELKKNSKL
jgi:hypothetical protein